MGTERRNMTKNTHKSLIIFPDDYTVVDIETTGLSRENDSIIELGAIRYRNRTETARYSRLIKPDTWTLHYSSWKEIEPFMNELDVWQEKGISFNRVKHASDTVTQLPLLNDCHVSFVSEFITELTHISNEMLADAPLMHDTLQSFLDFIGDDLIVGHNVAFDFGFISDAVKKHAGTVLENRTADTLRLSRILLPQLSRHRLQDLAEYYGMDYSKAHRAVEDCSMTGQAYENMRSLVIETYGSTDAFCRKYQK